MVSTGGRKTHVAGLDNNTSGQRRLSRLEIPSCLLLTHGLADANAAACAMPGFGFDCDLDIPTECRQQAHQAIAREVRKPPVEKSRNLRLIDPQKSRRSNLGEPALLKDPANMAGELCLGKLFLWIRKAKIGKHVTAARGHGDRFCFMLLAHAL